MDYRKMLQLNNEKEAEITVATIPVTAEDATGFGIMKTDDQGNIESFVEKPHASELEKWASVTSEEMHQAGRSEEHTSELQSRGHLVCRLLLEKKKINR